jgi:hypothetical protein
LVVWWIEIDKDVFCFTIHLLDEGHAVEIRYRNPIPELSDFLYTTNEVTLVEPDIDFIWSLLLISANYASLDNPRNIGSV